MQSELKEFFEKGKAELLRANQDRRHPFRLLTLATKSTFPEIRTVVKRQTNSDLSTLIYSDSRSDKVAQLKQNPKCSQLYYHPKKKLQLIMFGTAELLESGPLYDQHRSIAMLNARDYSAVMAPGSNIDQKNYKTGEEDYFILIEIKACKMELLELGKELHTRASFELKEEWTGTWLVP